MNNLLWRKLMRDFWIARGRMFMMIIAISVGILGIATILSAYTILIRESGQNYLGTNPASAQLIMDKVDDSLVDSVRLRPGIADAEASSSVMARIEKKPGEWMPLMLFVIKDFKTMRINTFQPESGAWPPPIGTILLEKEALPLLVNTKVGDARKVQPPNGPVRDVEISGLVHDPGLAPAWQEQTAWGYITPSTLEWLGESGTLNILKITVKDQPNNAAAIEKTVVNLAGWLKQQGHTIEEIRIPPPGKHPHQGQMNAFLVLLLLFSFLAMVLSAVLTATMISGLLARQVRQIAIMKAVGARTLQITGSYLAMIVLLSFTAVILGLPLGIAAGRGFAKVLARLLNIKIYSEAIPGWVYMLLLLTGILVPLLVALGPILQYTRITIQEAISDYGISRKSFGSRRLDIWLGKLRGLDRTLILSLRNTFRRRGRLLLTLGLLAVAGGMFISSLSLRNAWNYTLMDAASKRHYDLEIRLNQPEPEKKILDIVSNVPGVQQVESWNVAPAAQVRPDGLEIVRTYPDGGHGSFSIRAAPFGSKMIQSPLISGRYLQQGDTSTVVINDIALAFYPNAKVGDSINLNVEGHSVTLLIVGIVKELLTPPAAYVSPKTFNNTMGQTGQTNSLRIAIKGHDRNLLGNITKEIETTLAKENISIQLEVSETRLDIALNGHVYIFVFSLMFMASVIALIGAFGLMSTMGTSVVERTREFGIMRAIGAKSGTIYRNIISEGIFIGLMSWIVAVVLSLPLSVGIGRFLGNLAFKSPLPLVLSPLAVFIWLMIIVICSIAASTPPAKKAMQLTIRETLDYI